MDFVKTDRGICGISPVHDEYTLCGLACEGWYEEDQVYKPDAEKVYDLRPHEATTSKVITCPQCIRIVLACRGVRVRHEG